MNCPESNSKLFAKLVGAVSMRPCSHDQPRSVKTRVVFRWAAAVLFMSIGFAAQSIEVNGQSLDQEFVSPPKSSRPETWFHLIGGNVEKKALTVDLEAVAQAGFRGIQLFHGRGRPWPGVKKQIQTLSKDWDSLIAHVVNETQRLSLFFTMQNCPGWAMSGGPWITPDKAMRHLIWSRVELDGDNTAAIRLPLPSPSGEAWRDFRDVCVLAFPTPRGGQNEFLRPMSFKSNRATEAWEQLLDRKGSPPKIDVSQKNGEATWLEVEFERPVELRTIELPNVETLMKRRSFDPNAKIKLEAFENNAWREVGERAIPRGNWQDRQAEVPVSLSFSDSLAKRYRIIFDSVNPMALDHLRFSSRACVNDWRGKAGYVLRSLEYEKSPTNAKQCYLDRQTVIDLSDRLSENGELDWSVPQGSWTILRFGHVNTGVKNKPAPPEATGFECDKLSTAGADQHFAGYIGRISGAGGPADDGQLQGMLIDSWECYTQTWTPAMEEEFAKRRGYQLRQWMPAIAGYVVNDYETSTKFLRDWRKTISDLIVDSYFGRMAQLAKQRGMRLSFETAVGDVSPGDILEFFKHADVPMCEFWQPNDPHLGGLETKPVRPTVSAARVYGKPIVAAEAFTNAGLRWDEHPFQLKPFADRHFAMGINQLVFHTYTHNPNLKVVPGTSFGNRIGSPFLRGQTWWRHMDLFTQYVARCQLMLRKGQPVSDVLCYLGDEIDHKPRQDQPFLTGYQYDYVNHDALLKRIEVVQGKLKTPEGTSWGVLWMPRQQCKRLTVKTLKRLRILVSAGATVVCHPPTGSPTLEDASEEAKLEFAALTQAIWGSDKNQGFNSLGKGRVFWDADDRFDGLGVALEKLDLKPNVLGQQHASWCHRRTESSDIYFVAADARHPIDHSLKFRSVGKPTIWDPITGESTPVYLFDQANGYTTIPFSLPAGGSVFVVFDNNQSGKVHGIKLSRNGKPVVDASTAPETTLPVNEFPFGLQPNDDVNPVFTKADAAVSFLKDRQLVAWKNGVYQMVSGEQELFSKTVDAARAVEINEGWSIRFPDGWETRKVVKLKKLRRWNELTDAATRAFSGTATYETRFEIQERSPGQPVMLDLGEVNDIAEVFVNGKHVETRWAPPFRVDISNDVVVGTNKLEVKVTNTWHNRLVFDAGLKKQNRKTWTFSGPKKTAAFKPAGLKGPVRLQFGQVIEF